MSAVELPKRVLAPVDLSENAAIGLDYAVALATRLGAELVVMINTGLPERAAIEELEPDVGPTIETRAHRALERFTRGRLADDGSGPPIETAVTHTEFPGDGILAAARRHDIDLIVLCSHGRTGLRRALLGSVAEKVSRHSPVPVLIVPSSLR